MAITAFQTTPAISRTGVSDSHVSRRRDMILSIQGHHEQQAKEIAMTVADLIRAQAGLR